MSLITTAVELVNIAGTKLGGFGDQVGASGQLSDLLGSDTVTTHANTFLPLARAKAIKDLARLNLPFKETFKYADLEDDLKADDVSIASMSGDDVDTVTVVTQEAHGLSIGDTRFLADLKGDSEIVALNGTTITVVTVPTTTSFTFTDDADGDATDNTGIISKCPEVADWQYAFVLPSDFLEIVGQYNEVSIRDRKGYRSQYPCDYIENRDGDGFIFLTDNVSNAAGDSAYIGYVKDSTSYSIWSFQLIDCVATNLAIMLCPVIGRDIETQKGLEAYYDKKALPDAKKYNTGTFAERITSDLDYTGRKKTRTVSRLRNQLGTYVDAEGNRRDVY